MIPGPASPNNPIYKEFHQLSNPERDRRKGQGLGLSIVQRVASLLEYEIGLESELGKGSEFYVLVPQTHGDIDQSNTSELVEAVAGSESLVLIIDDDEHILEGLKSLLELWGCHVIAAAGGESMLAQLQSTERIPDAIISDYRLLGSETGVDVIKSIQAKYQKDIPALLVTGNIGESFHNIIEQTQFEVVVKPIPAAKIRAFLRSVQRQD